MAEFKRELEPSIDRGHLLTEQANPRSVDLDLLETSALVDLFIEEDLRAQQAVAGASESLTAAIEAIAERLRHGGRLYYLGARTSGRSRRPRRGSWAQRPIVCCERVRWRPHRPRNPQPIGRDSD